MTELLKFDQISYNEPVYWLEQQWGRKLTDHEKNIAVLIYRYTRTSQEAEEIKILDCVNVDKVGDKFRPKICCVCADEPERTDLKGRLFCNSCYESVYL